MRTAQTVACLCILAFVCLTGQTPPPAAAPGAPAVAPAPMAAKPLRHLEYAFTVSEQDMTGYEYNGISDASSGAGSVASSDGGHGTMSVDVLAIASDGSLIVRISEWVYLEQRARQAYACNVYGNTSVLCPSGPAPSEAEFVLLSYLGREFVDGAPWDAQNHWQRAYKNGSFAIQEDFVTSDMGDGKRVKIHEKKKSEVHSVGFGSQTDEVDITYDRSMEVPDTIHDDAVSATGDSTGHATFDFQLNKDSLAKQ